MATVQIPNNWEPRGYQLPLWTALERGTKRAAAVWHRRGGKDEVALHWAATSMVQKPATYWHMLPQANQARKAIWEAVNPHSGKRRIDEAFPKELRAATREQEMLIKLKNGATWQVVGSDNFDSLVGSPPYGVVFSEWSLANPSAWAFLRPILAENGGWALFIYTPRGKNHGKTTIDLAMQDKGWFGEILPASRTKAIASEILEQEYKEYIADYGPDFGKALYEQEYECSFEAAIVGSYYGALIKEAEDDNRITKVKHDRSLPVYTCWDLGRTDDTVIWFFQVHRGELSFIDYHESNGQDVPFYAQLLHTKTAENGYVYERHYLPHDAKPRTLASNRSVAEQLNALNIKPLTIVPQLSVQDGIQAVRQMLPRSYFDAEATADGLEALRQYQREWDDERKMFKDKALHNWASHAADAMRTGAVGYAEDNPGLVKKPIDAPMTFNDLVNARPKQTFVQGRI